MRLNYVVHRQEVFESSDDSIFVSYLSSTLCSDKAKCLVAAVSNIIYLN